jgi:hypothetical protein
MTLGEVREIDLYQSYYCPEGTLNDNHDHDRSRLDSNDILAKNNFNDFELNSIFLTMFNSTNLNQASFADVMKTFKIIILYIFDEMVLCFLANICDFRSLKK